MKKERLRIGTLGYLGIFICTLGVIMLAPQEQMLLAAGLCLGAAGILYPSAFRRLLHLRWIIILTALVLINGFFSFRVEPGSSDWIAPGLPLSQSGLLTGLMMALKAMVVLIAVDGFSSSVSISEVTGLLERSGMRGLGFSVGIAMNLLPSLRLAGRNAWYTLWMRGGLRGRRLHGLKLYLVTVLANTLRRAEEIALAAEARAFTPEKARWLPIKRGILDAPLWAAGLVLVILLLI